MLLHLVFLISVINSVLLKLLNLVLFELFPVLDGLRRDTLLVEESSLRRPQIVV